MTVAHLPRYEAVAGALTQARASVAAAAQVPAHRLSSAELTEAIEVVAALESAVQGLRLGLSAEADSRNIASESADTGTDAWLARLTGEAREVMAGGLWIARALQQRYHHTRAALSDGRIRLTQAKVIVRAADRAPAHVTPEQLADAEESLVAMATGEGTRSGRPMDARRLRIEARRMFAGILPPEEVDGIESDQLQDEESRAERQSWFMLNDNGDGTWSGRFQIPELHGQLLRNALEHLGSPRRLGRTPEGRRVVDESAEALEHLSGAERQGLAFCELLEHLPTDGFAGNAITLLVHIALEKLRTGVGAGRLDTGARVSASEARRLGCEAGLIPGVFGGPSLPLDLGRKARLHSQGQRAALSAVHDSCAVSGCERPFAWCEIHHPDPWSKGGRTDLDNALPLCGYHHRRAHDSAFDLRRTATGDWRFHRRR